MNADYMAEYRAQNPDYVDNQRMRQRAKIRALTRLMQLYPVEYHAIFKQEMRGLQTPTQTRAVETVERESGPYGPESEPGCPEPTI